MTGCNEPYLFLNESLGGRIPIISLFPGTIKDVREGPRGLDLHLKLNRSELGALEELRHYIPLIDTQSFLSKMGVERPSELYGCKIEICFGSSKYDQKNYPKIWCGRDYISIGDSLLGVSPVRKVPQTFRIGSDEFGF